MENAHKCFSKFLENLKHVFLDHKSDVFQEISLFCENNICLFSAVDAGVAALRDAGLRVRGPCGSTPVPPQQVDQAGPGPGDGLSGFACPGSSTRLLEEYSLDRPDVKTRPLEIPT